MTSPKRVVYKTAVPRYMTAMAVAEFLGVSRSTVYRLVDDGELSAVRVGHGIQVNIQSLHDYEARQQIQPGSINYIGRDRARRAERAA